MVSLIMHISGFCLDIPHNSTNILSVVHSLQDQMQECRLSDIATSLRGLELQLQSFKVKTGYMCCNLLSSIVFEAYFAFSHYSQPILRRSCSM